MKAALLFASLITLSFAAEERMSFLDNGQVKVGVDLNLGGAITWLSGKDGQNVVNNFDHGRQIQLSYFSGPVPFEFNGQKPAPQWEHIGWNPIQAGDDFHHGSQTIEHRNDGHTLYVKCVPLQWPLNNVPGECTMESWLELDGSVVKARARLVNARSDHTPYPARLQELPALYANAPFHRVVSYTGDRPFEGQAIELIPKSVTKHPWTFWLGTEQWSALLDESDHGIGLITPGRVWFTGGFAGKPGPNDTHTTHTGYLAGQALEVLDHNIEHEFRYEVVLGSLAEIRVRAKIHAPSTLPAWTFKSDRQGWHGTDVHDQGWPVKGELAVQLDGADPQLLSPLAFWCAEDAPFLIIDAAFKTKQTNATIYWRKHGSNAPSRDDFLVFPIQGDGEFRSYRVRLADKASYAGAIVQLRFDPVGKGTPEDQVRVRSIKLSAN
jgi:hypothetical protein